MLGIKNLLAILRDGYSKLAESAGTIKYYRSLGADLYFRCCVPRELGCRDIDVGKGIQIFLARFQRKLTEWFVADPGGNQIVTACRHVPHDVVERPDKVAGKMFSLECLTIFLHGESLKVGSLDVYFNSQFLGRNR